MTDYQFRSDYALYVPHAVRPPAGWPIMLFLHGAGERGTDVTHTTRVGLGPRIEHHESDFPCVIVFPQCAWDQLWVYPDMQARALAALDAAGREFEVDHSRVYLTGVSMGGYGVWLLASQQPDRYAAAVPVCGGYTSAGGESAREAAVHRLKPLPIWAFHGTHDDIIPVTESRIMVERLRYTGGDIRYTEYPDLAHNSWDRAFAEPELWPWVFQKRKQLTLP